MGVTFEGFFESAGLGSVNAESFFFAVPLLDFLIGAGEGCVGSDDVGALAGFTLPRAGIGGGAMGAFLLALVDELKAAGASEFSTRAFLDFFFGVDATSS